MLRASELGGFLPVHELEDFAGEKVLSNAFTWVGSVRSHGAFDGGEWDEGEERDVAAYVCVGRAEEELRKKVLGTIARS